MIILYHTIFPDSIASTQWASSKPINLSAFIAQISWLNSTFKLVSLNNYLYYLENPGKSDKILLALTFDDGLKETLNTVFPFLNQQKIPTTFFVSTGHIENGNLLWFIYLNALCFERLYSDIYLITEHMKLNNLSNCRKTRIKLAAMAQSSGDPVGFCSNLSKNYPLNEALLLKYSGLTTKQLEIIGDCDHLEVGAHTDTHPYLGHLPKKKQEEEIIGNKNILESLTGKSVNYFAFPSGSYNSDTIDIIKSEGYKAGFAVKSKNISEDKIFEIERVGIYSNSLFKLKLKVLGVAKYTRKFGISIG